jgi:hypothetical protein
MDGWTAIDDVLLSGVESELFSASSEDLIWHTNSIDGWYLFCFDIVKFKNKKKHICVWGYYFLFRF